jgi:hypothetical protein
MTVGSIIIYVALIGYIGYRRVQGQPVKASRQLFVLPVVLVVLGYFDVAHGGMKSIAITLTVIGAAAAFGLGLLRGRADKLSDRNGYPFMQWGTVSLLLFAGNIAVKLVLDLIGLTAGSSGSAVGKSLLLTFGLTLLGEAIVIWTRTQAATSTANTTRAQSGRGNGTVRDVPAPVAATTSARGFGNAVESHDDGHQDRRRERHDHHHRRHDRDAS